MIWQKSFIRTKYNDKGLRDNKDEASLSEVSASDITSALIDYRDGNVTGKTPGKQFGVVKYSNATLKRGSTESRAFVEWMKEIQGEKASRKSLKIFAQRTGKSFKDSSV